MLSQQHGSVLLEGPDAAEELLATYTWKKGDWAF
jgi:hypothetical protein